MARGNETTNSYPLVGKGKHVRRPLPVRKKMRSGTYQRFSCLSGTCQPILRVSQFAGTCRQAGICPEITLL